MLILANNMVEKTKKNINYDFSAKDAANSLISLLTSREIDILKERYGFEGNKPKTLHAIGQKLSLTRERVRQLEERALKSITKHNRFEEINKPIRELILYVLEQFGGFVSIDLLIDELNKISKNEEDETNVLRFLLKYFTSEAELVHNNDFEPSLRLFEMPMDFITNVLEEIENILKQENSVLERPEIINRFKKTSYYVDYHKEFDVLLAKNDHKLDKIIFAYMEASRKFVETPLNQWGLKEWEVVTPRRVSGKIYLVFLHVKKPMHFSEIAEIINKKWAKSRNVSVATVHNELISDDRFKLVKRGVYGLKEWK